MVTVDNDIPCYSIQCAKNKFMSSRPGLVYFAIGLVNSVVNLPNIEVFWENSSYILLDQWLEFLIHVN